MRRLSNRMRTITYVLVILSTWSQFDDTLIPFCDASPPVPIVDCDDDEYVSVRRDDNCPTSAVRRHAASFALTQEVAAHSTGPFGPAWRGPERVGPLSPSPLYVFMSLQL
jgi:hypothetical protein